MRTLNLIRSAAVTSAASLLSMLLGAITAKIIAVTVGPAGISVFSQLRQAGQFVTIFATLNGQNSLVRGISAREGKSVHNYAATIGAVFLLGVLLVGGAYLLLAPKVSKLLFPAADVSLQQAVYMVAALALFGALASYYQGVLNGLRLIRSLAITQVGAAVAAVLVVYPCIQSGHPVGYVVIVATGFVASIMLSSNILRRHGWRMGGLLPPGPIAKSWDKEAVREYLPFAVITLITGISGVAMLIAIRTLYIYEGGLALGGIFDAAWTVSMMYVMLLLSSFGPHYLPTLSGAKSPEEIHRSVISVFRMATQFGTPLVCTAIVFKPWLVRLLYSGDFSSAIDLLRWTMLGDYLKISGWVFGMLLIAHAERRQFALSELAWQTSVVGAVAVFLRYTHEIVGISYLLANAIYLLFVWRHARLVYNIRIDAQTLRIWLFGLTLVLLLTITAWEDSHSPSLVSLVTYILLLPVFLFFSISAEQKAWLLAYICNTCRPRCEKGKKEN